MTDYFKKFQAAAETAVKLEVPSFCLSFDIINDSPYDLDVQFGLAPNSLASVPPFVAAQGLAPAAALLISGNRWSGNLQITPHETLGGTTPGSSPAYQITVIGYSAKSQGISYNTLARQTNLGNSYYDQRGLASLAQSISDVVFTGHGTLSILPSTTLDIPLTAAAPPTIQGQKALYLVIRQVQINILNVWEPNARTQIFNLNIPGSANNFVINSGVDLGFNSMSGLVVEMSSPLTLTYVHVAKFGIEYPVQPNNALTVLTKISLLDIWPSGLNGSTVGYNVILRFNNSNAAAQNATLYVHGEAAGYTMSNMDVYYRDVSGNQLALLSYAPIQPQPLIIIPNAQFSTPIDTPSTNYGVLRIVPHAFSAGPDTVQVPIGWVVLASLVYQL